MNELRLLLRSWALATCFTGCYIRSYEGAFRQAYESGLVHELTVSLVLYGSIPQQW